MQFFILLLSGRTITVDVEKGYGAKVEELKQKIEEKEGFYCFLLFFVLLNINSYHQLFFFFTYPFYYSFILIIIVVIIINTL